MARFAILSDVHGNLEALDAVMNSLSGEKIDAYISLGDIIGYGANPRECLKTVESLHPKALIAGNHEWGALGRLDMAYFKEEAAESILWTRSVLAEKELKYIGLFKTVILSGNMTLVHGSLEDPAEFNYIFDCHEAERNAKLLANGICFIGHSHYPEVFRYDGSSCAMRKEQKVAIDREKKYIVNAGSIGQPRDGDPRASYALYDDTGFVEIRRVKYDVQEAQRKILKTGLPSSLALRLAAGR